MLFDVVEALEQDLCEPAFVPADPNVDVGRQCNEDSWKRFGAHIVG